MIYNFREIDLIPFTNSNPNDIITSSPYTEDRMKKLLSIVLLITTLVSLVACGGSGKKLTRGTLDGNVYTNEYLGFTFTKPSGWIYATDEEIAETMNLGAELYLNDDFKKALDNSGSIYDMMVVDNSTGTNMSVGYENLARSFSTRITVEEYIDALEEQSKNLNGISIVFPDEYDTVTLGEKEYTRVICNVTSNGIKMQQIYYLVKVDKYMAFAILTVTSSSKYKMSDIEAMFN